MPRFIVIDPSIRSIAGHYCEYALHVLAAARRAGYETALGTHREFRPEAVHGSEARSAAAQTIVPCYPYEYHLRLEEWPLLGRIVWLLQAIRAIQLRWAIRLQSSQGMGWLRRQRESTVAVVREPVHCMQHLRWRWLPLLLLLPVVLPIGIVLLACRALPRPLRPAVVLRGAMRVVEIAILFAIEAGWRMYQQWMTHQRRRAFCRATTSLIERLGLSDGDHVLVPTISPEDMLGLLDCFRRIPAARRATWHLVFRYNPYGGREPGYAAQENHVRDLKATFRQFHQGTVGCQVFFYSDTHPLIAQFQHATGLPFRLLPIPHTSARAAEPSLQEPLQAIYVGDARNEKGYIYLHRMIRDLWEGYVEPGRIRFQLQSHYNVPAGESKAIVGRAQLETLASAQVELVRQPLTSEEYRRLLARGHINLLPYDIHRYYARSSGILIETLAAGVPPVVPDGCWLGDELAEVAQQHRQHIRDGAECLAALDVPPDSIDIAPSAEPVVTPGGFSAPVAAVNNRFMGARGGWSAAIGSRASECGLCTMPIPDGVQALYGSFAFHKAIPGVYLAISIRTLRRDGRLLRTAHELRKVSADPGSFLVPLDPATDQVELALSNAFDACEISLKSLRLEALRHPAYPRGIPRSAVGIAVGDLDDLSAAVAEIVEHYEHYRSSARQYAEEVLRWHNADRLVEELVNACPEAVDSDGKPCEVDAIGPQSLALQEPR